jgi:hypothetical protein
MMQKQLKAKCQQLVTKRLLKNNSASFEVLESPCILCGLFVCGFNEAGKSEKHILPFKL